MSRYYNMNAEPISRAEAMKLFGSKTARLVASTTIGDVHVSTVLLVLDHAWDNEEPLIFETMIFGGEHSDEQWRYHTRAEAEAGHARATALATPK